MLVAASQCITQFARGERAAYNAAQNIPNQLVVRKTTALSFVAACLITGPLKLGTLARQLNGCAACLISSLRLICQFVFQCQKPPHDAFVVRCGCVQRLAQKRTQILALHGRGKIAKHL
ncbi:hypothetical protein [Agrobacterium tumefaciens]|uniref:Uncharacterized protein n=1 Tax=Agrobacterium tumefaciens TaxID=358 RepID=A0AAP9EA92_AGRTU|nr:hypothetical protein [Agrobacterium tumefaciens]NSZ60072.1 hypothetical protein [Agrobacterium tumefaciens]QDY97672.1 hypothetical protein CG010_026340 [Agrobacterium tumefaciens]UXS12795.1 hypothetical protein FY155_24480 [Agrobacterium tumefaciens]UXS27804.1 hypothetical protein FY153_25315 [Agrobacterium tumefaciens]UXS35378.1 hypothetical protein FY152_24885 [Agrobacterium tumefaciens]